MRAPMKLYLMQHGEARPEQDDPARPLTDRGRAEVKRVARAAGRLDLGIAQVVHSGKLRARQTAEIVAACLEPPPALGEMSGLGPNDDPRIAAEAVAVPSGHGCSWAISLTWAGWPHCSSWAMGTGASSPSGWVVSFASPRARTAGASPGR